MKTFVIPCDLANLEDTIFEHLPKEASQEWPERFITAVPVDADLTSVTRRFLHWLLAGADSPITKLQDEPGVTMVRKLYTREFMGDLPTQEEWTAAKNATRNAAQVAMWGTAWLAAQATVKKVAWAAARGATSDAAQHAAKASAWDAADVTARATASADTSNVAWAARSAAKVTAYEVMADKLIELIEQAPV